MNQSQDTEWGVKYLCYRTSMKKLHLSWSSNGPIGGQDCINTAMPYERTAKLWNNSFLCLPRDSLLKLRWSVSGELKGWGCLFMRNGQHARTRYLLCGKTKYEKSGKLDFLQPDQSFWTIISQTSVIQIWSSSSTPSLILLWLLIIGHEFWESLSKRIEFSQFSTIQVSVCDLLKNKIPSLLRTIHILQLRLVFTI